MTNTELENIINKKLHAKRFKDHIYNGLQVEGTKKIHKIITGVSICKKLINIAILKHADAIIVHHGMFWNDENRVVNKINRFRLKLILENNINLYCWHLPLDYDENIGNNVQIAKKLKIHIKGKINKLLYWGEFEKKIKFIKLKNLIKKKYFRNPFCYNENLKHDIKSIAWCSGKSQKLIVEAANFGVDAFLTGEVSEDTMHYSNEYKIYFFSAGHHATEIDGIKKLGEWIQKKYKIETNFINIKNPI
ncbi:Nif3-like dinuclear metal center hexameric protein [Buchnera aphidicola (Chaitoregma tattakana)]|uniref:Nif3-like dinuclear metal center hexameric protein n=1 Tax=Buchnera aphidicola TaxID=9 RepID=UPI0031B81062